MDAKLWYAGGSGDGGYGLQFYKDNTVITVNAGKTLSFDPFSGISTAYGSSAAGNNSTFNIYGTVVTEENLSMKTSGGKAAIINIYPTGSLTVGGELNMTSESDGGTASLLVDGVLVSNGTADYGVAVLTGNGTITHNEAALTAPDYY